jgi:hypothetical protein
MASNGHERAPLLPGSRPLARSDEEDEAHTRTLRAAKVRVIVSSVLTAVFIAALVLMFVAADKFNLGPGERGTLPKDPLKAARAILKDAPVIVSKRMSLHAASWLILCFRMDILVIGC